MSVLRLKNYLNFNTLPFSNFINPLKLTIPDCNFWQKQITERTKRNAPKTNDRTFEFPHFRVTTVNLRTSLKRFSKPIPPSKNTPCKSKAACNNKEGRGVGKVNQKRERVSKFCRVWRWLSLLPCSTTPPKTLTFNPVSSIKYAHVCLLIATPSPHYPRGKYAKRVLEVCDSKKKWLFLFTCSAEL